MIREIYCRQKNDPFSDPSMIEHSDIYEAILGKIRMLVTTPRGSVLSDPNFGCNLEGFIFNTDVSASTIEDDVRTQIKMYVKEASVYDITVKVDIQKGVTYDTGVVNIKIDGEQAISVFIE